jgi:hypothetical protein
LGAEANGKYYAPAKGEPSTCQERQPDLLLQIKLRMLKNE